MTAVSLQRSGKRFGRRIVGRVGVAGLMLLNACAPSLDSRPVVSIVSLEPSCPGYVGLDRARLVQQDRQVRAQQSAAPDYLSRVIIPAGEPDRPGPDAQIVLQAAIPESGMHPMATHALVWKDAQGGWWAWRRTFDYTWVRQSRPNSDGTVTWEPERYPAATGRLTDDEARGIEFLLDHPCRRDDPETWPSEVPLLPRGTRACPPDSARYLLRVRDRDGTEQRVSAACENDTMNFRLIKATLGQ